MSSKRKPSLKETNVGRKIVSKSFDFLKQSIKKRNGCTSKGSDFPARFSWIFRTPLIGLVFLIYNVKWVDELSSIIKYNNAVH